MRTNGRLFIAALALFAAGCGTGAPRNEAVIRIKGSESMSLLVQRWAEAYMSAHPGVSVRADGGGSADGIRAMTEERVELCATSRPLTAEETGRLAARHSSVGVSILGARDALSIVVHPSNPVKALTLEQVRGIFAGEIVNWRQAGGDDRPVTPVVREPNSGTYLYFDEHVMAGQSVSAAARNTAGARALAAAVAADSGAVGYSTPAVAENVAFVSLNGVAPAAENVRSGAYPVSRYLYLYSVHPPAGEAKKFVEWVTGPEGQRVVKENGYIPLYDVP